MLNLTTETNKLIVESTSDYRWTYSSINVDDSETFIGLLSAVKNVTKKLKNDCIFVCGCNNYIIVALYYRGNIYLVYSRKIKRNDYHYINSFYSKGKCYENNGKVYRSSKELGHLTKEIKRSIHS